jgi:3-hydroxymyristoyl/3-hydroxydecanoyl-(acyl carrier protein) dehydratase
VRAIREFAIDVDHPALPGHFPGDPLVPGSLVLDAVIAGQPLLRRQPVHIESVRFLAPLRPAQKVAVEYRGSTPDRLSFVCRVDGTPICKGRITLAGRS